MLRHIICYVSISLLSLCFYCKGQVLFDLGEYRNLAYVSTGYNGAFENYTIGIARRDYIRLIKREVVGVLDLSLPITNNFFTRHGVRKGFQMELYKKENLKIPFMFASSSIVRENRFFKYHDITAEFTLAPGIYTTRYSLALDMRYELIVFRYKKFRGDYLNEVDPQAKNHWEKPYYSIAKVGIMGGLNLKRMVIYIRSGYERNPISTRNYVPGYALIGFGYKFGTRPMKK